MIIPALLTTNDRIAVERIALSQQMSGWLHIDVLDNTLYQFESLSLENLAQLDFSTLSLEFHCMTTNPFLVLDSSLQCDRIILHYETPQWEHFYTKLAGEGVDTWIAIDPSTDVHAIDLPDDVGGILMMGVIPGQSGQSLREDTFERIEAIKEYYPDIPLTVDGGVKEETIRDLIALGVDNLIMGSGLFEQKDPIAAYERLCELSDPISGQSISSSPTG
jgi:ribulose-phosphate 3-epimerase